MVRLAGRRREAARRGGLPRRHAHRHDDVPRRRAGEAPARRGSGGRRQDRAGQGGGPRRGRRAGATPVLRGPRRGPRALRVELQEAAPPHPGRGRRVLGRDARRHLHRGVPAHPAPAHRDPSRGPDGPADRRGRQDRRRGRGAAARDPQRLPGDHPRDGHDHLGPPSARGAHLQRDPRAVRGDQATLPVPAHRLPRGRA